MGGPNFRPGTECRHPVLATSAQGVVVELTDVSVLIGERRFFGLTALHVNQRSEQE